MANKPYPFDVCEECASGGSGGNNDLSGYVKKEDGYGLATIMGEAEGEIIIGGMTVTKENKVIDVIIDGEHYNVKIPAYASDLTDDVGFIKSSELKTEIEKIFPDGDEVGY